MSEAFNKLDKLGKELTACQLDANMTIADISVVDALSRIKNIPLGVGSTVRILFHFLFLTLKLKTSCPKYDVFFTLFPIACTFAAEKFECVELE